MLFEPIANDPLLRCNPLKNVTLQKHQFRNNESLLISHIVHRF